MISDKFHGLSGWGSNRCRNGCYFINQYCRHEFGHVSIGGSLHLGPLSFTVLAVVALTNTYNLIDGINGLCGGLHRSFIGSCFYTNLLFSEIDFTWPLPWPHFAFFLSLE